jgi:hypothetical protein
LCATAFVLYIAFLLREVSLYDLGALSSRLEVLMFLLSFPLGTIFMYMFYTGVGGTVERILLWPIALAIGYIQWFHLIPMIRQRCRARVTTLNLSASEKVAVPVATSVDARDESRLSEKYAPPVPQFDSEGMTPLEKILRSRN